LTDKGATYFNDAWLGSPVALSRAIGMGWVESVHRLTARSAVYSEAFEATDRSRPNSGCVEPTANIAAS
jgi:hypothetical protein